MIKLFDHYNKIVFHGNFIGYECCVVVVVYSSTKVRSIIVVSSLWDRLRSKDAFRQLRHDLQERKGTYCDLHLAPTFNEGCWSWLSTLLFCFQQHESDVLTSHCEHFFLQNLTHLLQNSDSFHKLIFSHKRRVYDVTSALTSRLTSHMIARLQDKKKLAPSVRI